MRNRVRVVENGPLEVSGDLRIGDETATRATLCRCGKTKNAPYCNLAHRGAFAATGEPAPDMDDAPETPKGGTLTITPAENGPLRVAGPVEVVTGAGATVVRGEKFAFCRCGRSRNKPFCDGSHNQFEVPGA